jgi:hypothetical protein
MSDRFEYLFDLPYELIMDILSKLTIQETDKFCKQIAKQVRYGEERLKMSDLCDDIWKIKYVSRFGGSKISTSNWRTKYIAEYMAFFQKEMRKYIDRIEGETNQTKRILIIMDSFEFVKNNLEIFQHQTFKKFREVIKEKLYEIAINPEYENEALYYLDYIFGPNTTTNYVSYRKMFS